MSKHFSPGRRTLSRLFARLAGVAPRMRGWTRWRSRNRARRRSPSPARGRGFARSPRFETCLKAFLLLSKPACLERDGIQLKRFLVLQWIAGAFPPCHMWTALIGKRFFLDVLN